MRCRLHGVGDEEKMTNYEKIKQMSVEEMADIQGYEGLYKIDRKGNVYRKNKNRMLKPAPTNWGYLTVDLHKNGKGKTHKVHRMVAMAFIPNPDNKALVNHKDGNKLNNSVENLEWCTYSENLKHAWDKGLTLGNVKGVNQWKRNESEVKEDEKI